MKGIKMLGVAIVAAMAVMAFVGVGTASAAETKLCQVKGGSCTAWPAGTEFTAKSPKVTIFSSVGVAVTCESSLTFKNNQQSAKPLGWKATALTWSNCTGCPSVTATELPTGSLAATGGGNGTFTASSGGFEMKKCPLGLACKFKFGNTPLTMNGGASGAATLTASDAPIEASGGFCGERGTIRAGVSGTNSYVIVSAKEPGKEAVSNPSVFTEWVSGPSNTTLCKVQETPCSAANQINPLGMVIRAESAKVVFSGAGGFLNTSCEPSEIVFKLDEEPGLTGEPLNGKMTEMTWKSCHACPEITMKKLPSVSLSGVGSSGNGVFSTTSETEVEREECGLTGKHCPMTMGKGVGLGFSGGAINSTARVSFAAPVSVGGEASCVKFNTWNANGTLESQPYVIKSVNGATTGSIFVE